MIRKIIIPLLALLGFGFAVWMTIQYAKPKPVGLPVAAPPDSPYERRISGAGIIEAADKNVAVGAQVSGVVVSLPVRVGDHVAKGDVLFVQDRREAQANVLQAQSAVEVAESELRRLRAAPRAEEVPPVVAQVEQSRQNLADLQAQLDMAERVADKRAVSAEDLSNRRFAVAEAKAQLAESAAQLALLKAGSWNQDIAVAEAQLAQARANLESAEVDLALRTVTAPEAGRILQLNIRPGEPAPTGITSDPLVLMGPIKRMHLRVDIDENDAWRFSPGAPAEAFVRGNSKLKTPLTFEYVEPYVIPKQELTGGATERVDTRVLQVVYSFPGDALPVYVGQQMDVFIQDLTPEDMWPTPKPPSGGDK